MPRQYTILLDEEEISVQVIREGEDYILQLGNTTHRFRPLLDRSPTYSFLIDDSKVLEAEISFHQDRCEMNIGHVPYSFEIFDPRHRMFSQSEHTGSATGQATIAAPMPGKIVEVKVAMGEEVQKGQAVVIVEAMKMQNELASPLEGKVQEVTVKAGDTVESGQKLMVVVGTKH